MRTAACCPADPVADALEANCRSEDQHCSRAVRLVQHPSAMRTAACCPPDPVMDFPEADCRSED